MEPFYREYSYLASLPYGNVSNRCLCYTLWTLTGTCSCLGKNKENTHCVPDYKCLRFLYEGDTYVSTIDADILWFAFTNKFYI